MTVYDNYSTGYLTSLYYFIHKNIQSGNLSQAMNQELLLIRRTVGKRGVALLFPSIINRQEENIRRLRKRLH